MIINNPSFEAQGLIESNSITKVDNTDFLKKIASTDDIYFRSNRTISTSLPDMYQGDNAEIGASILLMGTAYAGYANHNSFALTPDMIWSLISDTVAKTVTLYPDQYSHLFMHGEWDGTKKQITVRNDSQTLDQEWATSINMFRGEMEQLVPQSTIEAMIPTFSTTGEMESLASLLSFMDAGSSYYTYRVMSMCGVPKIKLLGTATDYMLIYQKLDWIESNVEHLEGYAQYLKPILMKIAETLAIADSKIDYDFWGNCVKKGNQNGSGGGPMMTGWLGAFCGYEYNKTKNQLKDYSKTRYIEEYMTRNIGCCVPIVNFVWEGFGNSYDMKFIGGIISSSVQDGFIIPEFGYAVVKG